MKYKIINEDYKTKGLLESVLENRNITKEDIDNLLNADKRYYKDPCKISGMVEAVGFFKQKIMQDDLVVGLLVDEDVRLMGLQVHLCYTVG